MKNADITAATRQPLYSGWEWRNKADGIIVTVNIKHKGITCWESALYPKYLREEKEYVAKPCRLEGEEGFIYYHLPVTGGGDTPESPDAVAGAYLAMLDEKMDKIIHTIMDARSNVLYFCGAGKDRTGVVSAVILRKLGCSDRIIIKDYMETKDNLMGFLTSYVAEHPEVDINTIIPNENNIKRVLEAL